jgi:hypothetical protein
MFFWSSALTEKTPLWHTLVWSGTDNSGCVGERSGGPGDSVLEVLSVGTREQLATLLRLAIAEQLRSAIVLDDHLVQTDATRLAWFRQTLRSAANHHAGNYSDLPPRGLRIEGRSSRGQWSCLSRHRGGDGAGNRSGPRNLPGWTCGFVMMMVRLSRQS